MSAPAIAESGIHDGIPEALYFADTDALSASGAKVLLRNPARFRWEQDNPRPSSDAMDLGSIAHHLILHRGGKTLVVDAYDWRAKANQQARKDARAKGIVCIHRGELLAASKMARAVRTHPTARAIFSDGTPEASMWWTDPDTGARCRGRVDWLRDGWVIDLKTARDASPEGFAKAAANYGYRESLAHYAKGVRVLTGQAPRVGVVVVETDAPHFVAFYEITPDDLTWGEERMTEAQRLWLDCLAADDWPGYSPDLIPLDFPAWAY